MTPLLLELWRERHPEGIEQLGLNIAARPPLHPPPRLFDLGKFKNRAARTNPSWEIVKLVQMANDDLLY
jgi:hypothetical protein